MLARTPIRRQLGVIPIDEFDGEFLGMFYRSARGRVGRVLTLWAVYGTFGTRMRLLKKIQGEGIRHR